MMIKRISKVRGATLLTMAVALLTPVAVLVAGDDGDSEWNAVQQRGAVDAAAAALAAPSGAPSTAEGPLPGSHPADPSTTPGPTDPSTTPGPTDAASTSATDASADADLTRATPATPAATEAPLTTVAPASSATPAASAPRKPARPEAQAPTASQAPATQAPAAGTAPATAAPAPSTVAPTAPAAPATTAAPRPIPAGSSPAPTYGEVGPRSALTDQAGGVLPCGSYSQIRFTGGVQLQQCAYTFVDTDIPSLASAGAGYIGAGSQVHLSHSTVRSGLWFEGGGHNGWVIEWSLINGGSRQAMRPKGAGTITVSDTLLLTHGTNADPALGIHTETLQMLGGAQGTFTRVGLSAEPRWNGSYTPITAVANVSESGGGTVFTDCEFGYLTGGYWQQGGGYYAIYKGAASFVRPRIHASAAAAWYQGPPSGGKLVGPVYL